MINQDAYSNFKVSRIQGRYITQALLVPFLKDLGATFKISEIGFSVQEKPIYSITAGKGPVKLLLWSQMHGNESTTTKALLDFFNFLTTEQPLAVKIKEQCTVTAIPMLNPDGAAAYTRENANGVDLNRDAMELSQPESRALKQLYKDLKPDFCFNLHDQRTFYNVGTTAKAATLSFLAPALDETRSISENRRQSMLLIAYITRQLNKVIPGHIGRYDDSFNPNCVGDQFQMQGTPTLLFEAGHHEEDYPRESTRFFVFLALLYAMEALSTDTFDAESLDGYFAIPENGKLFFDVLILAPNLVNPDLDVPALGINYEEVLEDDKIQFRPKIEKSGILRGHFGHKTYDCLLPGDLEKLKADVEIYALLR